MGKRMANKAAATQAGTSKGQEAKKEKMAGMMLDKWLEQANKVRSQESREPTADDLNLWLRGDGKDQKGFMGNKDLGEPYNDSTKDRAVKKYFSKLVDKFYQQKGTTSKAKATSSQAAGTNAHWKKQDVKKKVAQAASNPDVTSALSNLGWDGDKIKEKMAIAIEKGIDPKDTEALIKFLVPKKNESGPGISYITRTESAKAMRKKYLTFLREAEARIQHAEDIIFWEGSKGAMRVLKSLRGMAEKGHQDVTLKWDGSPAIIFGRDESGQFIFTDKGGFFKKGGVGRTKSPALLKQELLGRSGGIHKDDPVRIEFANKMATLFKMYEKAVPQDHRGFFKGDLLYFTTPAIENNHYTFKPNIVTYSVGTETELGKRIGQSKSGVVIHREMDTEGNEEPFNSIDIFEGNDVLIVPSVTTVAPVEADTKLLDKAEQVIKKNAAGLDAMLHEPSLREKQLVDLPKIFYTYINSKVDTGLENLGGDFSQWLETSKLSQKKKAGVIEYINTHKAQFKAMWTVVTTIKKAKNGIIDQFDAQGGDVKQSIGDTPGGEGYVSAHPEGDIKLVPRASFSAANRASRN